MLPGGAFWKCGARSRGLGLEPSMWGSIVGKEQLAGGHAGCAAAIKRFVDGASGKSARCCQGLLALPSVFLLNAAALLFYRRGFCHVSSLCSLS